MAVFLSQYLGFILNKAPFRSAYTQTPTTASNTFSLSLWLSLLFVGHCSYFIQGLFAALKLVNAKNLKLPYSSFRSHMGCSVYIHPVQLSSQFTFDTPIKVIVLSTHLLYICDIWIYK